MSTVDIGKIALKYQDVASFDPSELECIDHAQTRPVCESPASTAVTSETRTISAREIEAIRTEFDRLQAEGDHKKWYQKFGNAAAGCGKKAAGTVVGFFDAVTAFRTALGVPAETPLPWNENDGDRMARITGYRTGMATNAAIAVWGTATAGQGMATAVSCGTVAGAGAVAAETGVGAAVAVGGGACAMAGLATAASGAAASTLGTGNLARRRSDYGRQGEGYDPMGRNRGENRQFAEAGRRVLRGIGIDPKSGKGRDILSLAHDILMQTGRRAGTFRDCLTAIQEAALTASGVNIVVQTAN